MDEDGKIPEQKVSGVVPKSPHRLPHLGMTRIFPSGPTVGRAGKATQMGTKGKNRSISWALPISRRVSGPGIKQHNSAFFPPVPCVL